LSLYPEATSSQNSLLSVIAFHEKAGRSQVGSFVFSLDFAAGHVVSGHTLKHLAAAAAGYTILRMLQKRQPVPLGNSTDSMAHA